MKVLMINSVCGIGSTGRICTDLAQEFERTGHEVKIAYGRDENVPEKFRKYAVQIGTAMDVKLHGVLTRIFDAHGFGSKKATKNFLEWAEEYKPDLLWLHNIHGYYINIEMLFSWIKKHPEMEVKWTLHDCWAFTGHCAYFTMANCDKWKTHCEQCPQREKYPTSKGFDNSKRNFRRKRSAFTGVRNMTLITPSQWLSNLVKQSYLSEYPVEVLYNKIDKTVFKPTPSEFRKRYGLENKKVILGVASTWDERKGLDDFIELAKMLDDSYAIVLVGLSKEQINGMNEKFVDLKESEISNEMITIYCSKQVNQDLNEKPVRTTELVKNNDYILKNRNGLVIPVGVEHLYRAIVGCGANDKKQENEPGVSRLICIQRTNNAVELAQIYTAADYFVNPTYEDNYPTVNLEAVACGTYVVTYDTGGCRETIK